MHKDLPVFRWKTALPGPHSGKEPPEVWELPVVQAQMLVRPGPERWRKDDIITRNKIKVIALGAGQKIRGRKHKQYRPQTLLP